MSSQQLPPEIWGALGGLITLFGTGIYRWFEMKFLKRKIKDALEAKGFTDVNIDEALKEAKDAKKAS